MFLFKGYAGPGRRATIEEEMSDVTVIEVADRERYEIRVEGRTIGYASARRRDGLVTMPHVEIDPAHRGQDRANQLVRGALDDVRARGERVRPLCPFVIAFLKRNPGYRDLVA